MSDEDNVLFVRGTDDITPDDVWDDTALIKAYDKAINIAKEEVTKRLGVENQNAPTRQKKLQCQKQARQTQKTQKKWFIGSPCRAMYSEDGELYEAVIIKIFENTGTCLVKFIGYNNKEKVELSSLVESKGLQNQIAQQKEAASVEQTAANAMEFETSHRTNGLLDNSMDCDTNQSKPFKNMYSAEPSFNLAFGAMPPAPPLPPQLMARLPENDADALSSMLMSWYISGFHTGYYHGLKQAQQGHPDHRKK